MRMIYTVFTPHNDKQEASMSEKKAKKFEGLKSFVYALLVALVFRSVAFEPFHIPSGSMLTTLFEGDYIFVSKYSYGYSDYSFPFSPDVIDGRMGGSLPQRGDVAVFRLPTDTSTDYIKRVIGLPGDTIEVRDGVVWINHQPLEQTRLPDVVFEDAQGNIASVAAFKEQLPEGKTHLVLDYTRRGDVDNFGPVTVPQGHYFMMGDNRDNSVDSRYGDAEGLHMPPEGMLGVGFVPLENFIGRAEIIAFSFKPFHHFLKVWEWPDSFREGRFWRDIDA